MNINIIQYLKQLVRKVIANDRKNKKKVVEFICSVLLAGIVCTCISCISIDVEEFNDVLFDANKSFATYNHNEIEYINYERKELELQTLTNDPQMLLHNVNKYVEYVSIYFLNPVQTSLPIQIFWCSNSGDFTEEYSICDVITAGESTVAIKINQNIDELRVDVGNQENIVYDFDKIVVGGLPKEYFIDKLKSNKSIIYERFKLLFYISFFILLHIVFGIKYMFQKLFKYRWIVGLIVLIFLVGNMYNGDSLYLYNDYIQPHETSEWSKPIYGEARPIRSDEWLVTNPQYLSTRFLDDPYGKYNNILRGKETLNDNRVTWYSIYNPILIGRTIINEIWGFDYAYSFNWYFPIILCFLLTLELMYIITNKNRIISICATCMILMSSYYLWWGFPSILLGIAGSLVCFYYFFQSTNVAKRIMFAFGTSIFTAYFALILYPAWQVPAAYIMGAVLIWIVHEKWYTIKNLKIIDWCMIACALVLCVATIIGYISDKWEYIETITQTVYPGKRVGLGGNWLAKIFYYVPAVKYAYSDVGNPSEMSACISLFPLPLITGICKWLKEKKKDWLSAGLIIVSLFLIIYVAIGVPEWIAKITLIGNSIGERAVDLLEYCQILLFARVFATWEQDKKLSTKSGNVLAIVIAFITVVTVGDDFNGYVDYLFILLAFIILTLIIYLLIVNINTKYMNISIILLLTICLGTGIYIRPISKGIYSVDCKPIAKEISEIASNDNGKWIAIDSIVTQSYLVICGAQTINSTNIYPNLELYHSLDPERKYEDIYNRYAHVVINLTQEDTSFELVQADLLRLNLSFRDIDKIDVKYILSTYPLEIHNEYADIRKIYDYDGAYIYKIM